VAPSACAEANLVIETEGDSRFDVDLIHGMRIEILMYIGCERSSLG